MDKDLHLETIRQVFNEYTISRVRCSGDGNLTTLEECIARELDSASSIEELRKGSKLAEMMALIVVLTHSGYDGKTGDTFSEVCQKLAQVFVSVADGSGTTESKKHFGRPLIRRTGQQLSGPHGTEASEHLWIFIGSSLAAELPRRYSNKGIAAIMYLLLSDLSRSLQVSGLDTTEIPCLLDMVCISGLNNFHNIAAICGEYLGFVGVCVHEKYAYPDYTAESEEVKFDFSIVNRERKIWYFSVKSVCFLGTRYFGRDRTNSSAKSFVSGENEANVLLHDCDCHFCGSHPIRKVVVWLRATDDDADDEDHETEGEAANRRTVDGLGDDCGCSRRSDFLEIMCHLRFGVVYLVSAKLFYDLRYVLSEFDQKAIRGASFPLREHFRNIFQKESRQKVGTRRMQTLVQRMGIP